MRVVVTDAEVTLADVLSVRLSVDGPPRDDTRVVLRQRGTGVEREVAAPGLGGRSGGDFLEVPLGPLDLSPGRWDAYLCGGDQRVRVQSVDPGFSLDRLDAYALSRRTLAYRAYRTRNGFLALKISDASALADVRAVWFREGRFEVTGLLAYTGFDDDEQRRAARLELRRDGDADTAVTANATVQGVRFHAALSLCDVIEAAPDTPSLWRPLLKVDGLDAPLRLGARIDDVGGKQRRVSYPAAEVDGVPFRPYYTADDELRLGVGE